MLVDLGPPAADHLDEPGDLDAELRLHLAPATGHAIQPRIAGVKAWIEADLGIGDALPRHHPAMREDDPLEVVRGPHGAADASVYGQEPGEVAVFVRRQRLEAVPARELGRRFTGHRPLQVNVQLCKPRSDHHAGHLTVTACPTAVSGAIPP